MRTATASLLELPVTSGLLERGLCGPGRPLQLDSRQRNSVAVARESQSSLKLLVKVRTRQVRSSEITYGED